jgi:methylated-DNA-[protein]-cysteine S-methyltransferase
MTVYDIFPSPIGAITASTDGVAITALHVEGDRYFTVVPGEWVRDGSNAVLQQLQAELGEYFAGTRARFDVPVAFEGTEFQRSVWSALQSIGPSETTSYGALAAKIGRPKAVRAVGTAVGRNPLCIVVPCHRVLASDGTLGGYVAGLDRKRHLLTLEGALAA